MRIAEAWRGLVRRVGAGRLWAAVWVLALAGPWLPPFLVVAMAAGGWLSALILAPGRFHGRRLTGLAALFFLFWSALLGLIHLIHPSPLRPIVNLAAWLALGLNLMLAKTPLELALPAGRALAPILGRRRAQKLALALALLARLIPRLLGSALTLRLTVQYRAGHLSLHRRLVLWGGAIVHDAFSQSGELSRALLKRWPW